MTDAAELALIVAERLRDPAAVVSAVPGPDSASLTHGLAGTALLHARLAAVDPAFGDTAERHWEACAVQAKAHPIRFCGISNGRGGIAASLIVGSAYLPDRKQHHNAAERAAAWLSTRAIDLANHYAKRLPGSGAPWHVYDTITGLAGTGRVLLAAAQTGHATAEPGLSACLSTLTAVLTPSGGTRPGWHLPASAYPNGVAVHPSGAATTGMAHGVAGPLAVLATAHTSGWTVAGQIEAIKHAAAWLMHWRRDDGRWPPHVTGDELDHNRGPQTLGRADAWCYGTPGIARALTLAAHALADPTLADAARTALASMADRGPDQWDVEGPTLCHGHAGVLQGATCGTLAEAAAIALVQHFDPYARFGFRHFEHRHASDEPGLLTGAAGVALALADHAEFPSPSNQVRWDCLLVVA